MCRGGGQIDCYLGYGVGPEEQKVQHRLRHALRSQWPSIHMTELIVCALPAIGHYICAFHLCATWNVQPSTSKPNQNCYTFDEQYKIKPKLLSKITSRLLPQGRRHAGAHSEIEHLSPNEPPRPPPLVTGAPRRCLTLAHGHACPP